MNLAIDQGNSSTKLGFFDKSKLISTYKLVFIDKNSLNDLRKKYNPDNVIVSSVTKDTDLFTTGLKNIPGKMLFFDHNTPLPIENIYESPESLGIDRLAAAVGAATLYPKDPLLVVDAGSAITFDLVTKNTYYGGNISPGLQMRFAALHQQTKSLPKVERGEGPFLGKTTEQAIRSGVQNGIKMELEGYIESLKKEYPDLKTILTGGDADFFVSYIKNIIFVHPNLVLSGLNRIIEYNA
ncbi:MAG: type III pantothenate kinase [Bacteroidota bacterium]